MSPDRPLSHSDQQSSGFELRPSGQWMGVGDCAAGERDVVRQPSGSSPAVGLSAADRVLLSFRAVARLVTAITAYHAAVAKPADVAIRLRYLAAASAATGAHAAALFVIGGRRAGETTVLAQTAATAADRLVALGRLPRPAERVVQSVRLPERGGPALVVARERLVLCLLRDPGRGDFPIPESMLAGLLCSTCDPSALAPSAAPVAMSTRRDQVLRGLLDGRSEKEIGATLGISPNTVHTHVRLVYRDHGVHSRSELLGSYLRQRGEATSPIDTTSTSRSPDLRDRPRSSTGPSSLLAPD